VVALLWDPVGCEQDRPGGQIVDPAPTASQSRKRRLQNVSTMGAESGGFLWMAVNEMEHRNSLLIKRVEPEVAQHHHVRNRPCSEFESLPPGHYFQLEDEDERKQSCVLTRRRARSRSDWLVADIGMASAGPLD
jgi:hypothetical protein